MKILLVDDSKTMRNIQKAVLTQLGHTDVQEACDGQDAMSKVGAYKPDLMLVDWNMLEMNGLEFVKSVRSDNRYTEVKLMMVTTETQVEQMLTALEAGANEYVMKPFTKEVIEGKLRVLGVLQ